MLDDTAGPGAGQPLGDEPAMTDSTATEVPAGAGGDQAPQDGGSPAATSGNGTTPEGQVPGGVPLMERQPAAKSQATEQAPSVTLTRDELAETAGCPLPLLNDLERFGLLRGRTVGRGVLYDHDALVVARLAAQFARHGLEPRHLRSFRLAAEREIGLFAQVVGPLMQRRDASAHGRAMETLTELADLASELHEVLVRDLVNREFGKS